MKKTDRGGFRVAVALGLAGAGLLFVPAEAARPVRSLVRDLLRPGQMALAAALRCGGGWRVPAINGVGTPAVSNPATEEVRTLRLQNRRLELQVTRLRERLGLHAAQPGFASASAIPPLVNPHLVEARVLGEETASFWRGHKLLSAGAGQRIAESALVLNDARPLVDAGADARLAEGDAVYAGRTVIGKIAEVGRFSSTLRLVTDPGYSGRARLARRTSQGLVFGAEGTLVGDGTDVCRLRHITDPVNIDDEVFTGGADGLIPFPMYYGRVVRAELETGSNEWSIWVHPAASDERLESVLILRREINAERIH